MAQESGQHSASSRLRNAAFAPIGDEGRATLVETRLLRAISSGAFIEGDRLPSENELSQLLGVAVVTVREALNNLRHQGVIETRRGRNGGSFVRTSYGAVTEFNAEALIEMPRAALVDLGLLYEVIVAACGEYACRRATVEELDVVRGVLADARKLPADAWRRRITDVQLELASLSQSVRLTSENLRVQAELTPLLALQDDDSGQREKTHAALEAQIDATEAGDVAAMRESVRASIRTSIEWLTQFRNELIARPAGEPLRVTLDAHRSRNGADGQPEEAA